jgi:hypothetical protein
MLTAVKPFAVTPLEDVLACRDAEKDMFVRVSQSYFVSTRKRRVGLVVAIDCRSESFERWK